MGKPVDAQKHRGTKLSFGLRLSEIQPCGRPRSARRAMTWVSAASLDSSARARRCKQVTATLQLHIDVCVDRMNEWMNEGTNGREWSGCRYVHRQGNVPFTYFMSKTSKSALSQCRLLNSYVPVAVHFVAVGLITRRCRSCSSRQSRDSISIGHPAISQQLKWAGPGTSASKGKIAFS